MQDTLVIAAKLVHLRLKPKPILTVVLPKAEITFEACDSFAHFSSKEKCENGYDLLLKQKIQT
jgi:hypothetical protein